MAARRLLYWFMVSWPAVLLFAVAIDSRFKEDPYVLPQQISSQNARIAAYAGPVRATAPLLLMASSEVDISIVESSARYWIEGLREERLLPLYSTFKREGEEGVKAEIFAAKRRVTCLLIDAAKARIQEGDLEEAASNLLDSFEIGEVSKFADFRTISAAASLQRRALAILAQLRDHLPEGSRKAIAYRLREILHRQASVAGLITMSCRSFLERDIDDLSSEDREMLSGLPEVLKDARTTSTLRVTITEGSSKCTSNGGLVFFSEIRQGVLNQLDLLEQMQAILTALEPDGKAILAKL